MKQDKIQLYCCSSIDQIEDKKLNIFFEQKGGPRYFIEKILKQMNVEFASAMDREYVIKITVDKSEESGTALTRYDPVKISKMSNGINVISTILDDISLEEDNISGRLFIDIQGIVRSKLMMNNNGWNILLNNQKNLLCKRKRKRN